MCCIVPYHTNVVVVVVVVVVLYDTDFANSEVRLKMKGIFWYNLYVGLCMYIICIEELLLF